MTIKKLYWRQNIFTIPRAWKEMFLECEDNISDLIIKEYYLIKKHQIYFLEKRNSRELCNKQLLPYVEKPTAQTHFKKKIHNPELEWKYIYALPRRVTINTNLPIIQYKLLRNILHLIEIFYKFGKKYPDFARFA